MLTFGSLFAGIGGFDRGFELAEMECKWQVEIDEFCLKVLAKHWPDVARYKDVRECGKHNLESVDVICGGFPCQPHSVAGKRKGAADDRDLWPEYRRIIAELRPRYVVAENVPGIRTTILDQVLSDLEGLVYSTRTLIVPACAFNAPHRRERVFILAHTVNGRSQERRAKGDGSMEKSGGERETSRLNVSEITKSSNVADTTGRSEQSSSSQRDERRLQEEILRTSGIAHDWTTESGIRRVAHGVPGRVDRLRGLGNAVVPQVAEWIGKQIIEAGL